MALQTYEQPLVSYAFRLTGNVEVAREVVQDTFMRLCQQDVVSLDGRLGPWLYTVCRNRAFDVRKKERRMTLLDISTSNRQKDSSPLPDEQASSRESRGIVLAYLGELPDKQQEAVLLKFEHGLTFREISAITGMPLSTVSHTLTKAIKTLRGRLLPILRPESSQEGNPS